MPAQALGLAILAFSFVVKVPQIRALQKSHSAEGLSSISFELEQLGLSVHTAFGFLMNLPFNTFGEALIILVQNTILLTLLYKYKPVSNTRPAIGVALTAIGISACYYGRRCPLPVAGWQIGSLLHCMMHLSAGIDPASIRT